MGLFSGSAAFRPHSLKAQTLKGLESKIERLQAQDKCEYRYISFYFDGKNHVCWFYKEKDFKQSITESINENK